MTAAVVSELAAEMVAQERPATDIANDIGQRLEALNGVYCSLHLMAASAPDGQWGAALARHIDELGHTAGSAARRW